MPVAGSKLWPYSDSNYSLCSLSLSPAPCVPQNIQNNLDCLSGVLNVTWQSTGHVVWFHASVMSSKGHASSCRTDKRYCVVRNLQCGLTYNVTVVAQDESCNSSHSPTKQVITGMWSSRWYPHGIFLCGICFHAARHKFNCSTYFILTLTSLPLFVSAPCPLMTYLPTVNCTTGVVSVTWNDSMPGVMYTVSAVGTTGRQHNCSGTNSGCNLSMLECGTKYNISITPSRNGCVGRDSPQKMITTGKDRIFEFFYL